MPCLITERRLCPIPLTSEQVRRTLWMGVILHGMTTVCGFLELGFVSITASNERERLMLQIESLDSPIHSCTELLLLSRGLLTISGVTGSIAQCMSYPNTSPFLLTATTLIPWGLGVVALVEAVLIDMRGYQDILTKSLHRESYSIHKHSWIHAISVDEEAWDEKLQTPMECCGLIDNRDWFSSTCNCIPPSCCKTSERLQCENQFLQKTSRGGVTYKKLGSNPVDFTVNEKRLWEQSCVPKLQELIREIRNDWVLISLVCLCIDFWLAFLAAYLCYIIQELNESDRGRAQLHEYKWALPIRKKLAKHKLGTTYQSLEKIRSEEIIKRRKERMIQKRNEDNWVFRDFIEIKPPGPNKSNGVQDVTT